MTKTPKLQPARKARIVLLALASLTLLAGCATTDDEGHTRTRPTGGEP